MVKVLNSTFRTGFKSRKVGIVFGILKLIFLRVKILSEPENLVSQANQSGLNCGLLLMNLHQMR
ncbi:hypothetical protein AB669_19125 [Pedobacter sp. BMA]|nr:hypothetical protein AB669_19125 [Pedobacter sp. BMA]